MKAIVIGWFGKHNLGDDLLEDIINKLILKNTSISSIENIPIDKLNNKNIQNKILTADFVFLGPGGLINRGIDYIIAPLKTAKNLIILGVSIEDYSGTSDNVIKFISQKAIISLFRDDDSVNYFKTFYPTGHVYQITDLYQAYYSREFPDRIYSNNDIPTLGIPRLWNKKFIRNNKYFNFLFHKLKCNESINLLQLLSDSKIITLCKQSDKIMVLDQHDLNFFSSLSDKFRKEFINLSSNIDNDIKGNNVISARFHGTLIGLKNGVYTESYCYQNKLKNLCSKYTLPVFLNTKKDYICLLKLKDEGQEALLSINKILKGIV